MTKYVKTLHTNPNPTHNKQSCDISIILEDIAMGKSSRDTLYEYIIITFYL